MRINGPWKVQGANGQVLSFSFKFQNSARSCILESPSPIVWDKKAYIMDAKSGSKAEKGCRPCRLLKKGRLREGLRLPTSSRTSLPVGPGARVGRRKGAAA